MIKTIFGCFLDGLHDDKYGHIDNAAAPHPMDFRNSRRLAFNIQFLPGIALPQCSDNRDGASKLIFFIGAKNKFVIDEAFIGISIPDDDLGTLCADAETIGFSRLESQALFGPNF